MDLNELQSVQSRERQTDSLQQLRATFYRDAADYIQQLEAERDAAAERADDPWNAPEVGRLNDDIDTAKDTVEAIYERRVGKIVKMASLAAADMPTDDEGLTEEEQALFDRLVTAIERNREGVFAVLDGEDPTVDPTDAPPTGPAGGTDTPAAGDTPPADTAEPAAVPDTTGGSPDPARPPAETTDPSESGGVEAADGDHAVGPEGDDTTTAEEGGVDAADLMAGGSDGGSTGDTGPGGESAADAGDAGPAVRDGGAGTASAPETTAPAAGETPTGPAGSPGDEASPDSTREPAGESSVDRSTVRITDDVGPIYGVEGRAYELSEDDVVTLPEPNVGPLLRKGAAERID